jgi:hypothetical protein
MDVDRQEQGPSDASVLVVEVGTTATVPVMAIGRQTACACLVGVLARRSQAVQDGGNRCTPRAGQMTCQSVTCGRIAVSGHVTPDAGLRVHGDDG